MTEDSSAETPWPLLGVGWDRFQGWRTQYDRMLRWRDRLVRAHAEADLAQGWADEAWDITFAFFQNAYHPKDWIVAERPDLRTSLEELIQASAALALCADICNGTKHRQVTRRHRVPGHVTEVREYLPNEPTRQRLVVLEASGPQPVLELADECVNIWRGFIERHLPGDGSR